MDGYIFSIEEFSTFDGPGIRTTVFLKGCPLHCQWCHNPEGQSALPQFVRSPNGCLNCDACIQAGFKLTGSPCLIEESIYVCPKNLVRYCGEKLTPEQLFTKLEPKLWMLNNSGGGITFSGGEPLSQPHFLLDCLKLLEGKTHRAIQTSGYAPTSIFERVLKATDYVLFDLKHMDADIHMHYTGVDNRTILENYKSLASSGVPFITRIPLIPGVNDTDSNIEATAAFMHSLQVDRIELLPYNTGAGAKYRSIGREYRVEFDTQAEPSQHREIFKNYGIEVTVL